MTGFMAVVTAFQFLFLLFFIGLNAYYSFLNVLAFPTLMRYMRRRTLNIAPQVTPGFAPPPANHMVKHRGWWSRP